MKKPKRVTLDSMLQGIETHAKVQIHCRIHGDIVKTIDEVVERLQRRGIRHSRNSFVEWLLENYVDAAEKHFDSIPLRSRE